MEDAGPPARGPPHRADLERGHGQVRPHHHLEQQTAPLPAAVALYLHGRTQILALDFDTKHHDQHTVDTDFTRALTWITEAGGRTVTDQSTSGGRHILVPLAAGTSATAEELAPLLRLLEARLPSLDKTPMTNPKTGCITAPGSPCREGGHRRLDGPLSAAVDAFTQRSEPALLPRLNLLLGALTPATSRRHGPSPAPDRPGDTIIGTGPDARLRPEHTRTAALPARITTYATTGVLPPDTTWRSHSEARQSVLAHAALHGHSLATIHALIAPGRPWQTGLGGAYRRYHAGADAALARDFHKALNWAATNTVNFQPARALELKLHTRGVGQGARTPPPLAGQRDSVGRTRVPRAPLPLGRGGCVPGAGHPRGAGWRSNQRGARGWGWWAVAVDCHGPDRRNHGMAVPA